MKSSWARARTRLRSSDGWNEKSKPSRARAGHASIGGHHPPRLQLLRLRLRPQRHWIGEDPCPGYDQALIPADELLPALYLDHPRPDVRQRYPKSLVAYAFEPPLVTQLTRDAWGTDTEDSVFVRLT
jgi:hypothetical protein